MYVYHRLEPLNDDSGKQHCFTWEKDDGQFLCHAMYQSGADLIPLTGGGAAARGKVLRIQTDSEGETRPGHGIAIQVDGDDWREEDYVRIAYRVRHDLGLSTEQQQAVFAQIASLLNLMATRYGDVFVDDQAVNISPPLMPSPESWQERMSAMITNEKLKIASIWFAGQAAAMIEGKADISTDSLVFPNPREESLLPALSFSHEIKSRPGMKAHLFHFYNGSKDPITAGFYTSGEQGESLGIKQYALSGDKHAFQLRNKPRENSERFDTKTDNPIFIPTKGEEGLMILPGTVLPAEVSAHKLQDAVEKGEIVKEQRIAALLMLGSVYRLIATRYNGAFGYNWDNEPYEHSALDTPRYAFLRDDGFGDDDLSTIDMVNGQRLTRPLHVHNAKSLATFIEDPEASQEANRFIKLAAEYMMDRQPTLERLGKLLYSKAYTGIRR